MTTEMFANDDSVCDMPVPKFTSKQGYGLTYKDLNSRNLSRQRKKTKSHKSILNWIISIPIALGLGYGAMKTYEGAKAYAEPAAITTTANPGIGSVTLANSIEDTLSNNGLAAKADNEHQQKSLEQIAQPKNAPKPEEKTQSSAPTAVASQDTLADYIMRTYNGWNKKHNKIMPKETAIQYSGWINKYAQQYNIDPLLLAALVSHESRFTNTTGDLVVNGKKTTNNSEGLTQIRKLTQIDIKKAMKAKGDDIEVRYENLNNNPELAIKMTAFYLDNIIQKDNCSLWHAFGHYNGGMGYMNASYSNKVMGEYNRIESYLSAHKQVSAGNVAGIK